MVVFLAYPQREKLGTALLNKTSLGSPLFTLSRAASFYIFLGPGQKKDSLFFLAFVEDLLENLALRIDVMRFPALKCLWWLMSFLIPIAIPSLLLYMRPWPPFSLSFLNRSNLHSPDPGWFVFSSYLRNKFYVFVRDHELLLPLDNGLDFLRSSSCIFSYLSGRVMNEWERYEVVVSSTCFLLVFPRKEYLDFALLASFSLRSWSTTCLK